MADTSSPAAVAGQAEATTQARRYAWQTYLSWKEKNGESWESVVLEMEGHKGKDAEKELMGETIMVELIGLQEHLIEEDIKNRSNPNTSTSTDTLAQYFGQVKEMMKERYGVSAKLIREASKSIEAKTGADATRFYQVPGRARRAQWAFTTAATLAMADGPLPFGDVAAIAVLTAYGTYEVVEAVGDIKAGTGY